MGEELVLLMELAHLPVCCLFSFKRHSECEKVELWKKLVSQLYKLFLHSSMNHL